MEPSAVVSDHSDMRHRRSAGRTGIAAAACAAVLPWAFITSLETSGVDAIFSHDTAHVIGAWALCGLGALGGGTALIGRSRTWLFVSGLAFETACVVGWWALADIATDTPPFG